MCVWDPSPGHGTEGEEKIGAGQSCSCLSLSQPCSTCQHPARPRGRALASLQAPSATPLFHPLVFGFIGEGTS